MTTRRAAKQLNTVKGSDALSEPNFYRYRYLMGAMQQAELTQTVRLLCLPSEVVRLSDVVNAWQAASARMTSLAKTEPGEPDKMDFAPVPAALSGRLKGIAEDPLFQATFSALPSTFGVIEIDRLVAPQREVNLDYVDDLRAKMPGTSVADLLDFCIAAQTVPPDWKKLQTAANQIVFTSKSFDLRFLGGFQKPLAADDVAACHVGGQPTAVVPLLVGYGGAAISVIKVGPRAVLFNGFHRVVAMRMAGVTHIPVVIQEVAQPKIQFPQSFLNLSREYLLGESRPVVVKDFFDEDLIIELRVTPRRKMVKVTWSVEESIIPI
jgi:hypothetical protein